MAQQQAQAAAAEQQAMQQQMAMGKTQAETAKIVSDPDVQDTLSQATKEAEVAMASG